MLKHRYYTLLPSLPHILHSLEPVEVNKEGTTTITTEDTLGVVYFSEGVRNSAWSHFIPNVARDEMEPKKDHTKKPESILFSRGSITNYQLPDIGEVC